MTRYKPDNGLIASEWEVRTIPLADAREIIARLHYAGGSANTATFRHGLFRKGDDRLMGAAVWIPPTKAAALATHPDDWRAVLSLSRLVLEPDVPTNGATFLLSRSVKMIRQDPRWKCLVTYADTWRGHQGTIYKAAGWSSAGMTKPERTYTINGVMTARKAGPKTRTHAEMLALGATLEGSFPKHKFVLLLG